MWRFNIRGALSRDDKKNAYNSKENKRYTLLANNNAYNPIAGRVWLAHNCLTDPRPIYTISGAVIGPGESNVKKSRRDRVLACRLVILSAFITGCIFFQQQLSNILFGTGSTEAAFLRKLQPLYPPMLPPSPNPPNLRLASSGVNLHLQLYLSA